VSAHRPVSWLSIGTAGLTGIWAIRPDGTHNAVLTAPNLLVAHLGR